MRIIASSSLYRMHAVMPAALCTARGSSLLGALLFLLLFLPSLLHVLRLDTRGGSSLLGLLLLGRFGVVQLLQSVLDPVVDCTISQELW